MRLGNHIAVSGTAPIWPDGGIVLDAKAQAKRCLEIALSAVEELGGSVQDVVRTRMFITRADVADEVSEAHGEVFRDVRPAATMVVEHAVNISLPADLPMLYFDSILMERVFCNLLENAAKYTPSGSVITISAKCAGKNIEISVEDNGPGLPAGKEEALFAKFARGRSESTVSGVGLGLSIVKAIVEAHDGTIRAEKSSLGGARFVITMPCGEAPEVPKEEIPW